MLVEQQHPKTSTGDNVMFLASNIVEIMLSPGDYKILAHLQWHSTHNGHESHSQVLFDEKWSLEEMQKWCRTAMYNQAIDGHYFVRIFVYDHGKFTDYAYSGNVKYGTAVDKCELQEYN